jgi:ABC-type nickel/cobalt efflux system permease component RcnA
VAIALVVVVLTLLQLPARQLHLSSFWLEKGSYLLVGALGLAVLAGAEKAALLLRRPTFTAFTRITFIMPLRLRASASAGAGTAAKRR